MPITGTEAKRCVRHLALVLVAAALGGPGLAHAQQHAQPGKFDLYLFTLSWSPQYCASHTDPSECNADGGNFVVHGLWPQFKNGSWPSKCSDLPGPDPATESDIMPASLVAHEWSTHGTCSGLGVTGYFDLIRSVRRSINIPPALLALRKPEMVAPSEIKAEFAAANPSIRTEDMAIGCAGNALVQVQFCTAKDGQFLACGTIRDCRASMIRVLPVLP